jgi:glyceraldehyde 3-phosphate dehydrogenase (phosphorylating)
MPTKIAINGLGHTGLMFLRAAARHADLELVAVNDLADAATLAHLLKHDSTHGALKYDVKVEGDSIFVAGRSIQILSEHDPAKLPWQGMGVRIAIESSGKFRTRDKAKLHLDAGTSKVLISAPGEDADVTLCLGVNQQAYDPRQHQIISNASCTANCLAPIVKVLHESFGIAHSIMTTVHAYTNSSIFDAPLTKVLGQRMAKVFSLYDTNGAMPAV